MNAAAIPTPMPDTLLSHLSRMVGEAFHREGAKASHGRVILSNRPDLCDVQCNGAFAAAEELDRPTQDVAKAIASRLQGVGVFENVSVVGGFLNFTLPDQLFLSYSGLTAEDLRAAQGSRIIIDYGGANIAKPLHIGHLRAAIIGESLKRISRALGHEVIGDVHLGDWGLQMGMVLHEISLRQPDLPYFAQDAQPPFPDYAPVTLDDLDDIYPVAAGKAEQDTDFLAAARRTTLELQQGHAGYQALWRNIVDISVRDLRADYSRLNVSFDLWNGESTVNDRLDRMVRRLVDEGHAHESDGALIIDVAKTDDKRPLPPFILQKSDGAVLYSTTDLATIEERMEQHNADVILYVVDKRQSMHFQQVFRAARKTGIAPPHLRLEHIGFGTMNGPDGKPFKTRAGGTMKLKDLIEIATRRADERLSEASLAKNFADEEQRGIAEAVGIATLKYADLSNTPSKDYVFDIDRFSSFEGRTGPYLLYTAIRAKAILQKAAVRGEPHGPILPPRNEIERELLFTLSLFGDHLVLAFTSRSPTELADYGYRLASSFSKFYHKHNVLREPAIDFRASSLELVRRTAATLTSTLDLLGMTIPSRM